MDYSEVQYLQIMDYLEVRYLRIMDYLEVRYLRIMDYSEIPCLRITSSFFVIIFINYKAIYKIETQGQLNKNVVEQFITLSESMSNIPI